MYVVDLLIDAPVLDSYRRRTPDPRLMHQANAQTEVRLLRSACTTWLTCFLSRQAKIEKLSDKVLLYIFCYYLDASPRLWPTLMHICRKWRRLVFASQRVLQLQLLFTHGTPVLETLDCWPTLPIVVQYGGSPALSPPASEDDDNIMAALKHSDRVTSISLTVTSSLLKKLSALERPFSELEDLVLLSRNGDSPTLPRAFLWGSRRRRLRLTGMTSPALLQLLNSSRSLVYLHLHEVLDSSHIPPDALTRALSGMVQLRSISLHFLSTANHLTPMLPSGEVVVLPALSRLDFKGTVKYLEDLVARIETPLLEDIEVSFLDESNFELPKFHTFTDRIGMHKLHRRADIMSSECAISISLIQPGTPTCLKFHLFREPLSEQLLFMARICVHFSAFLLNVEDLHISVTRQSHGYDNGQWLQPLNSFTGVKWFHVVGNLSTDIVRALQLSSARRETLLPALHKLRIRQPVPRYAPLTRFAMSLMTSRRLSGQPIAVEYERLWHISERRASGTGTVHNQC